MCHIMVYVIAKVVQIQYKMAVTRGEFLSLTCQQAGTYFNKNVDYRATCPQNIYLCVGWRLPDTTWSHEVAASPSIGQTWMLHSLLRPQQRHLRLHHSPLQWPASQAHAKWSLSGVWWWGRQCQFHSSRDANPAATHLMQVRTTGSSAHVSVVDS